MIKQLSYTSSHLTCSQAFYLRTRKKKKAKRGSLHPVKSCVLRLCPVLSRFYPRVQRLNKNRKKKQRPVNSLRATIYNKVKYIERKPYQSWLVFMRVRIELEFGDFFFRRERNRSTRWKFWEHRENQQLFVVKEALRNETELTILPRKKVWI